MGTKSKSPSKAPSKAPSKSPTKSKSPSKSPSKAPSKSPTTFFDATADAAGDQCAVALTTAFNDLYATYFGAYCKKPTIVGSRTGRRHCHNVLCHGGFYVYIRISDDQRGFVHFRTAGRQH